MNQLFIARHRLGFLLNEQCHIRVFLEAVANAVEMQVKALLLQLLQARENGRAVEVGTDADGQQFRFGDARRQNLGFTAALSTQAAEGIHQDSRGDAHGGTLHRLAGELLRTTLEVFEFTALEGRAAERLRDETQLLPVRFGFAEELGQLVGSLLHEPKDPVNRVKQWRGLAVLGRESKLVVFPCSA